MLGVSAATLGIAEYGLALIGFPAKIPLRVAHPPNYSELRKSGEFRVFVVGIRLRKVSG